MGSNSAIEWTDATWIIDRGGRRVRSYHRKDSNRPGMQERRRRRAVGEAWCRGCRAWMSVEVIPRQGACRPCLNREYRERYVVNPVGIRARVHARQRKIAPLPTIAASYLLEQFADRCAYCPGLATTWDHVVPVVAGGETVPGNIVPACTRCNSSKRDRDVVVWLASTERTPSADLFDIIALTECAA